VYNHAELHSLNFFIFLYSLEYLYFSNQTEIYEEAKRSIKVSLNFILRESENMDLSTILLLFLKAGHIHLKLNITDQVFVFARRKLHRTIIEILSNSYPEDILNFFKLMVLTQAPLMNTDLWELVEYQLLEKLDQFELNDKIIMLKSLICFYFQNNQEDAYLSEENEEEDGSTKNFDIIITLIESIYDQAINEAPFEYQEFLKLKFEDFELCLDFLHGQNEFLDSIGDSFNQLSEEYGEWKERELNTEGLDSYGYKDRLITLNQKEKLKFEWEVIPNEQFEYWLSLLFLKVYQNEPFDFEVKVPMLMDFHRFLLNLNFTSFTKNVESTLSEFNK
jgi:hypothetical protein